MHWFKRAINRTRSQIAYSSQPALADRLHLPEGDWLGLVLSVTVLDDFSRYIVAWKLCTTMKAEDVTDTLTWLFRHRGWTESTLHIGLVCYRDNGPSYVSGDLAEWLEEQDMRSCPRRALSSDDPGQDRALASDAQEPHPAGELLSARRSSKLRSTPSSPTTTTALPREHRQSDAGRRLLRARSNHPAGKRKDQTQNHPIPTLASSKLTPPKIKQDAPDPPLDHAAFCLKSLTTDTPDQEAAVS